MPASDNPVRDNEIFLKILSMDEEAWQALVTGIEKYRQICFSFGDENGMSDGKACRRKRRQMAPFALKKIS